MTITVTFSVCLTDIIWLLAYVILLEKKKKKIEIIFKQFIYVYGSNGLWICDQTDFTDWSKLNTKHGQSVHHLLSLCGVWKKEFRCYESECADRLAISGLPLPKVY